eukprot:scaffold607047_cov17-Prasinocladus_malaysianus.AAC.1
MHPGRQGGARPSLVSCSGHNGLSDCAGGTAYDLGCNRPRLYSAETLEHSSSIAGMLDLTAAQAIVVAFCTTA